MIMSCVTHWANLTVFIHSRVDSQHQGDSDKPLHHMEAGRMPRLSKSDIIFELEERGEGIKQEYQNRVNQIQEIRP